MPDIDFVAAAVLLAGFIALVGLSFLLPHKPLSDKDAQDFKDAGEW